MLIKNKKFDGLRLRPLDYGDLEHTLRWRNHPDHRVWFNHTDILKKEDHYLWFDDYQKKTDDIIFIVTNGNHERLGQLSLYHITDREAEFGRVLVNPDVAGRGIMSDALSLLLPMAHISMQIPRIYLEVKDDNHKAIALYQKHGFTVCQHVEHQLIMHRVHSVSKQERNKT